MLGRFVEDGDEAGENAVGKFGVRCVVDLIAGGPENDAGMIAVSQDGIAGVMEDHSSKSRW